MCPTVTVTKSIISSYVGSGLGIALRWDAVSNIHNKKTSPSYVGSGLGIALRWDAVITAYVMSKGRNIW